MSSYFWWQGQHKWTLVLQLTVHAQWRIQGGFVGFGRTPLCLRSTGHECTDLARSDFRWLTNTRPSTNLAPRGALGLGRLRLDCLDLVAWTLALGGSGAFLQVTGTRYALDPLISRRNIIINLLATQLLPFLGQLLLKAEVILGCKTPN